MSLDKDIIRKDFLSQRLSLTALQCREASENICTQFFQHLPLAGVTTLHCFLSLEKKNEPDTSLMIDQLKKNYPKIRIAVPAVDEHVMKHFLLDQSVKWEVNKWGIRQPMAGITVGDDQIDVVLVPMIICDRMGNRVGYGKGYYDRFLVNSRKSCLKIGLSFFEPLQEVIAVAAHDIPLDGCVTPTGFYDFKGLAPAG